MFKPDHELSEEDRLRLASKLNDATDDASNDVEFLVGLAAEALKDDEAFDSDAERAEWVVAQWCQELQWLPDLSEYSTGECIEHGEQEGQDHV